MKTSCSPVATIGQLAQTTSGNIWSQRQEVTLRLLLAWNTVWVHVSEMDKYAFNLLCSCNKVANGGFSQTKEQLNEDAVYIFLFMVFIQQNSGSSSERLLF